MDELQKAAIRLKHWIDHNEEHLNGYREVADHLAAAGQTDAAACIRRGIEAVQQANREFTHALEHLPESPTDTAHEHGHSHHHHDHSDHEH